VIEDGVWGAAGLLRPLGADSLARKLVGCQVPPSIDLPGSLERMLIQASHPVRNCLVCMWFLEADCDKKTFGR